MNKYAVKNSVFLQSETDSGEQWKDALVRLQALDHYTRMNLYCVKCGGNNLTYGIIKFFQFNPDTLTCWDCQGKANTNEHI